MARTAGLNQIAFVDPDGQVGLVAPDGRDLRQLTTEERLFQFPAWSPDNTLLAAIGSSDHEAGVYVLQPLAGAPTIRRIYNSHTQPPIYLSWSPDNSMIGALAIHPTQRLALYLLEPRRAEHEQTHTPIIAGQPCFWEWHGDSRGFLVHVDLGRSTSRLVHVRWRDGAQANFQELEIQPGYFQAPSISMDGRQIAYVQLNTAGQSQLVVASRDRRHLLGSYQGIVALTWSPRRQQLAYICPDLPEQHFHGPLQLWDGDRGETVVLSEQTVLAFFWSPSGDQIALISLDSGAQVLPSSAGEFLTNGRFLGSWPFATVEPASVPQLALHVIDIQTRRSKTLLTFSPHPLWINQFLPFFDQYAKSHRLWSPQSDALVIPVMTPGQVELQVVSVSNGAVRPIAPGVMATWCW